MKKAVGIILVLVLVFSFATTSLAAEEVEFGEGDVGITVTEDMEDPNSGQINVEDIEDYEVVLDAADTLMEDELAYVEETLDEIIATDPAVIKHDESLILGDVYPWSESKQDVYSEGGYVILNHEWFNDVTAMQVIRIYMDDVNIYDFLDVEYDEELGAWKFWVDTFQKWQVFITLVERGVDPEVAAQIASSPKTADNGTSTSMMWVVLLMASVLAVAAVKKARQSA